MATTIQGDVTTVIPVEYQNSGGQPVTAPSGDTVTVQNDSAAIDARVEEDGTHNRSLVLTPVQPAQAGAIANVQITDTLSDGTTITTAPEAFEIAVPLSPVRSMALRLDMMTTRPLPSRGGARVTISR